MAFKNSEKNKLRLFLSSKISAMDIDTINKESIEVSTTLTKLNIWGKNTTILIFLSMRGKEIETSYIIKKAWEQGKTIAIPRMYGNELKFHIIAGNDLPNLNVHPYGILEPESSVPVFIPSEENKALIIIPGLGFSPDGKRIGRGKGYYDRYLQTYGKYLDIAGIALSCQIVDKIPVNERDVDIPVIVTPNNVFYN